MSLKGSLETVALPEVLKFLSDTGKTGDLHVRGSHIEGRIWFAGGTLSGHDVGRSHDTVEALFQLLRNEEGDFDFSDHDGMSVDGHEVDECDLDAVLELAHARFEEWNEIVAVVPSLDHRLTLAAEAPNDSIVVDRDQWAMLVAIGEGRTVAQTIDARQMGEFDGCRAVKVLLDASLVTIAEPDHPHFAPEVSFEPMAVEPVAVEPEAVEPEAVEPVPFEAVIDEPIPFETEPTAEAEVERPLVSDETSSEASGVSGDHYAALRSMIVDVDKDLSESGAAYDPIRHAHPEDTDDEAAEVVDGKTALQALLAEVSSYPVAESASKDEGSEPHVHGASVDGLADRGPWPEDELASFNGWTEPEASAEDVAEEETAADEQPSEEPMNRGLLLKFLSSVRN